VPIDEAAKTAAGQPLACLIGRRYVGLVADMLDRNRIACGEGFFQRFVELPFLASPVGFRPWRKCSMETKGARPSYGRVGLYGFFEILF
jgi:hypothetical protein